MGNKFNWLDTNQIEKKLKSILPYFIGLTLTFTVVFVIIICFNFSIFGKRDWETTAQVGDFFGGVVGTLVGAIGFILIYLSFVSQTNSQKKQEEQFLKSQIESRFFELIKLHKENVNDIEVEIKEGVVLEKHKAIDFIYNQILQCYSEISFFFKGVEADKIFTQKHLNDVTLISNYRTSFDIGEIAKLDVAYSIVFFGCGKEDISALGKLFYNKYQNEFISQILNFITLKFRSPNTNIWYKVYNKLTPEDWISITKAFKEGVDISTLYPLPSSKFTSSLFAKHLLSVRNKNIKYYGGHQYKLGHYFRHLFQAVKYINEQTILNYEEKYNYIKTLRAQLSTIEQYLIFFNSLSFMGRAWEYEHISINPSKEQVNNWLITKYNFIKNIPDLNLINDISIIKYYPEVHFEFEDEPKKRKDLTPNFN